MVQLGVIASSASADHRALAWHAYLWDPWFLVWGLLVTAALLRTRHRNNHDETGRLWGTVVICLVVIAGGGRPVTGAGGSLLASAADTGDAFSLA